ncbi:MAG: ABC transporter permease [Pirellulales bacterium]|nr:ABC transporter permease [Pirellulales bacterium]
MILWKFTRRELKSRPGRATLTLLSIVIGVAAMVAVDIGTTTTHHAYQTMYEGMAGRAAFEVVAEDGSFFPETVADSVRQVPGVKAAIPSVQQVSTLWHGEAKVRLLVLGIDPNQDEAARDYQLQAGEYFGPNSDRYDALLEAGFAQGLGVKVGDAVKLGATRGGLSGGIQECRVIGLLAPQGAANFNQGGVIFLKLRTAEYLFAKQKYTITQVGVVLDEGTDETAVQAAIAGLLPAGLTVRSPLARAHFAKETMQGAETGLDVAYVLMIILGLFTIFNTYLMNVGERRRQLAVMRAVGATRGQITRMLLLEGLAMGFAGTLFGSLLGLGGAYLLADAMSRVFSTPMPPLQITAGTFILAAGLGPVISLLAMFIPTWIASRISPLESMRFVPSMGRKGVSLWYVIFSLIFFLLSGSALAACVVGYLPIELTVYVGAIFTTAFVLLIPIVLNGATRLTAWFMYPIFRAEGKIAQRQLLRRTVRTTLTIGLLYIAVSTATNLGTTIINNVDDIRSWQAKTFQGDFIIRRMNPDVQSGKSPPMPEALGDQFRAIKGVANVESIRTITTSVKTTDAGGEKQYVTMFIRDFNGGGELPLVLHDGDPQEVKKRLEQGEVVIGTVLANRTNTNVGDKIAVETGKGPKTFTVAGTATAYLAGGKLIYMQGKAARKALDLEDVDTFVVNAQAGALESVRAQLKPICDQAGLMLHSFADLRRRLDNLMTGVIASLWGLLALGFVVGAFGIANTLTMNVLEQTRELALLRVVAMTRRQVRKTILAQAVIIGFIGLGLGIAGGIVGSYITNICTIPVLGYSVAFAIHPSLLAICFAFGLAVIILAAWLPAERAARLNLLIALQYE